MFQNGPDVASFVLIFSAQAYGTKENMISNKTHTAIGQEESGSNIMWLKNYGFSLKTRWLLKSRQWWWSVAQRWWATSLRVTKSTSSGWSFPTLLPPGQILTSWSMRLKDWAWIYKGCNDILAGECSSNNSMHSCTIPDNFTKY